ncbi:uncharacterized protein LOC114323801 [Camellia sinensis]|uniref:uncharacterized protein LOC114323801 n=1 Tax=Camellia sinensis TaxID=4442 RepID=UPI001036172E|nr:uncharacterized protein LOC114323801 [Camellia sinensis]
MEQSQTQSMPSKALRKRGSKQTQQQSTNVHKASWDSDTVRIFLELVIKELDVGFKGSFHTMTMHGYRAISKGFLDRTNKVHDVKQLQNKYALLKKDWQSWSKLMDNRHGPTGISYNEATGWIQASDDWWAHYEKGVRRRYSNRKYAWTPGAAFEPVAPDDGTSQGPDEDCEDNSGLPPFQPAAQHEHTVQHTVAQEDGTPATVHAASSGINADDIPTSGMNKRKSPGPTHPQRKRGQSEGASLLASSMENLASSVKLQQRQIRVSHDYADSA